MLIVLKSGSLNLLELSGPVQACNGIALHFNFLTAYRTHIDCAFKVCQLMQVTCSCRWGGSHTAGIFKCFALFCTNVLLRCSCNTHLTLVTVRHTNLTQYTTILQQNHYCERRCSGDQMEKHEIDGACSTYGGRWGVYSVLMANPEGKRPLEEHRHRWRIILRRIFRIWNMWVWTGLVWPRIERGGGRLWVQ